MKVRVVPDFLILTEKVLYLTYNLKHITMYGNDKKKNKKKSVSPMAMMAATVNKSVKKMKPKLSIKKTVTDTPKRKYTRTIKNIKY